ncbi:hypothetical protein ANI02nite_34430 [Acetobacter nitrogenifigens DSM 23921 = NBRC 105050]|uniref:Uncharacterized protein n=1 Tax=Acetobacter nitrogenifigens DSM 23921 = NBRC 105050 TaxID=1120919 RepID=A0A511XF39_9PROT|nr:hypothetical protein ANI02nite_34430 [Acetobacter nitrogenifigens DSM 23921 = NBRC 105050]
MKDRKRPPERRAGVKGWVLPMLARCAACAWVRSRRYAPPLPPSRRPGRGKGLKEKGFQDVR